jgi:hypothetical protein
VLLQQIHCYPIGLLRYYGNASNSLLCNSNHHVTIVMQQTHYYSTVTITLLWKCNMVHRSCYHGKRNMSQYKHKKQTSKPSAKFEPAIPATKRPQNYATDREATGIGSVIPTTLNRRQNFIFKGQHSNTQNQSERVVNPVMFLLPVSFLYSP